MKDSPFKCLRRTSKKAKPWSEKSKRFLAKNTFTYQKKLQYCYGHFCKKDVPILSQVSPYWVKLFSKRVPINPPQFCFVLSRSSRQVPAFYILWSLTCFVIILAFFPTIFQLELWPLGLLSNYLYHFFFFFLFMQQSNLQNSMLCVILENDRVKAKYPGSVKLIWSFKLDFLGPIYVIAHNVLRI